MAWRQVIPGAHLKFPLQSLGFLTAAVETSGQFWAPEPDLMKQMFLGEARGFQITHEGSALPSFPSTNFPDHRKHGYPVLKSGFPPASSSLVSRHLTQPPEQPRGDYFRKFAIPLPPWKLLAGNNL